MSTGLYIVDPFDTTAFREGRPFEQGDEGLSEAASVFPPPPPALTGAVQVALVRAIGVPSKTEWRGEAARLATSPHAEDKSRGTDLVNILDAPMSGPFVVHWDGGAGWHVFTRCPADLLFDPDSDTPLKALGQIRLAKKKVQANVAGQQSEMAELERFFSDSRAPALAAKAAATPFLKLDALHRYLGNGKIPGEGDLVRAESRARNAANDGGIAGREARIGIAVDKQTGTALTSQLYAAEHRRLKGADRKSRFFFACEAPLLQSLRNAEVDAVVPLGGEGRYARVRGPIAQSAASSARIGGNIDRWDHEGTAVRVVALTPIPVAQTPWGLALNDASSLAKGTVMGAVHERPSSIGFIPRAEYRTGRIRIIRAFPAGSIWWLKIAAAKGQERKAVETIAAAAETERLAPTELARCGFGRFAAGRA